jgi:hypothetical protein
LLSDLPPPKLPPSKPPAKLASLIGSPLTSYGLVILDMETGFYEIEKLLIPVGLLVERYALIMWLLEPLFDD